MTPSADLPGLDLSAVTEWLATQGVALAEPVTASLFTGGRSNVTYRLLQADGTSLVLRRPPLGHVLPSAHDMSREYRVLRGLNAVGYPTPRTIALCEDPAVNGTPFLVMAYVDGRIVATADDAQALSPDERDGVSAALVEALARLHSADVDAAGLAELGRPEGYLPRQLGRWTKQWELTKTRDLPAMDVLRERIANALAPLPADLPWSLVHGDYRLDNVILAPDDRRGPCRPRLGDVDARRPARRPRPHPRLLDAVRRPPPSSRAGGRAPHRCRRLLDEGPHHRRVRGCHRP